MYSIIKNEDIWKNGLKFFLKKKINEIIIIIIIIVSWEENM